MPYVFAHFQVIQVCPQSTVMTGVPFWGCHRMSRNKQSGGETSHWGKNQATEREEQRWKKERRNESGTTRGGGRAKTNTHFFQPTTPRIWSWKCWKQLNSSQFKHSACWEGKTIESLHWRENKKREDELPSVHIDTNSSNTNMWSFNKPDDSDETFSSYKCCFLFISVSYWVFGDRWKLLVFWWSGWGRSVDWKRGYFQYQFGAGLVKQQQEF